MTIREALIAKTENLSFSDGKLDLVLLEGNLDSSTVYDPEVDGKAVDMVWLTLLLQSITVSEVREDDVSIKYTNNLKDIASAIYRKYGMVDPFAALKPTVTQKLIW